MTEYHPGQKLEEQGEKISLRYVYLKQRCYICKDTMCLLQYMVLRKKKKKIVMDLEYTILTQHFQGECVLNADN